MGLLVLSLVKAWPKPFDINPQKGKVYQRHRVLFTTLWSTEVSSATKDRMIHFPPLFLSFLRESLGHVGIATCPFVYDFGMDILVCSKDAGTYLVGLVQFQSWLVLVFFNWDSNCIRGDDVMNNLKIFFVVELWVILLVLAGPIPTKTYDCPISYKIYEDLRNF